jgi:hypothetical protein
MGWLRGQGRALFAIGVAAFAVQMLMAATCCLPSGQPGSEGQFADGAASFVICTASGLMTYDPVTGEKTPLGDNTSVPRHATLCAGVCVSGMVLPLLVFLLVGVFTARRRIRPPLDESRIVVSVPPAFFGRGPPLSVSF